MKKLIVFGFFCLLSANIFAKKEPQAWKTGTSLETQFSLFKDNVNLWDGYLMTKVPQLDEFHQSLMDTIKSIEKSVATTNIEIATSKEEINHLSKQLSDTQTKLEASLLKENTLTSLGMSLDKTTFPTIVYIIIIIAVLIALFAFFLFFRSNSVTKETEKRYLELTEEFQSQKVSALERETKLRRELQTERNKNYAS